VATNNKKLHAALMARLDVKAALERVTGQQLGDGNIHCPFPDRHDGGEDTSPSFSVDADTGKCYCHACGYRASSVVGLVQELECDGDYEAAIVKLWNDHVEPLVPVAEYMAAHSALLGDSPNLLMMQRLRDQRGLLPKTIKKYKIGWKGNRLWIPVFNEFGLPVDVRKHDVFKRRKKDSPKTISYAKGYGGARLYPVEALAETDVVLCEGEMDTLLARQLGLNAMTITSGGRTMKAAHAKPFRGKRVLVLADNDVTGREGAQKKVELLAQAGADAAVVHLPVRERGEDFTDFILKYKGDADALEEYIVDVREADDLEGGGGAAEVEIDDPLDPDDKEQKQIARGERMMRLLRRAGGFFRDDTGTVFYATDEDVVPVSSQPASEFARHLNRVSETCNPATTTGRFILHHVAARAGNYAAAAKMGGWSMFVPPSTVYVYSDPQHIIRVSRRGKISVVRNAVNDEGILLHTAAELGVKYDPEATIEQALDLLWTRVARNFCCSNANRYLAICWLVQALLPDLVRAKPLVRFTGGSAKGKSAACKLISHLMLGDGVLLSAESTIASCYAMAKIRPITIIDNIETRNMTPERKDFLLLAATGGTKSKRARESDSAIIMERINCLVVTSGIDPFTDNEIVNRTLEISVDPVEYGRKGFHEDQVHRLIDKDRDVIFSGLLKFVKRYVLPRIVRGELNRIVSKIDAHAMERFNDSWAVMGIIADGIWGFIPGPAYEPWKNPRELFLHWIDEHGSTVDTRASETSEVVYFFNTLVERRGIVQDMIVKLRQRGNVGKFTATTRQLLTDFRVLARAIGSRCPWKSERELGVRIADAMPAMEAVGWKRRKKRVGGKNTYEYTYNARKIR